MTQTGTKGLLASLRKWPGHIQLPTVPQCTLKLLHSFASGITSFPVCSFSPHPSSLHLNAKGAELALTTFPPERGKPFVRLPPP